MDAIATYLSHGAPRAALDRVLEGQRILFCCQSRLLATLWVRAACGDEQPRESQLADQLAGSCTTLAEALQSCRRSYAACCSCSTTTAPCWRRR